MVLGADIQVAGAVEPLPLPAVSKQVVVDGFTVTAPVQVIGSYSSDEGSWLWSWANPSVIEPLTQAARLARAFGETYELSEFTQRKIQCLEDDAWRFAAVGLHLSRSAGCYRGPAGSTFVFMTFGEVSIRKVH